MMRRTKSEFAIDKQLPSCDICVCEFDTSVRRPLLLPSCGHTFCGKCLTTLIDKGTLICPSCRETYNDVKVSTLPVNFSLLSITMETENNLHQPSITNGMCEIHGVRNSFWCKTCEVVVCGECLFDIHSLPDHEVTRFSSIISQMKDECREMVDPTKKRLTRLLLFGLQRVLIALSNVQTTSLFIEDMVSILSSQEKILDLDSAKSVVEKTKVLKQKVLDYREYEECHKENGDLTKLGGEKTPTNAQSLTKGVSGHCVDPSEAQGYVKTLQPNWNKSCETSTVENPSPINGCQQFIVNHDQDPIEKSQDPAENNFHEHGPENNDNFPEEAQDGPDKVSFVFTDHRVSLVAFSEGGRVATLKLEDKGLHIYSLRPNQGHYNLGIKLAVLEACVSKTAPIVFLDISAGRRPLGRIYLELNGEMQRAKQFMALCLGNLGPSYLGTGFDEVYNVNKSGEYIRGGDYMKRGGQGGKAIMANLEWGGKYTSTKKRGVLCGVGGEQRDKFGALFAICTRDDPTSTFQCCFGRAIQGIETLEIALRHDPFHLVQVGDCGLVIRE